MMRWVQTRASHLHLSVLLLPPCDLHLQMAARLAARLKVQHSRQKEEAKQAREAKQSFADKMARRGTFACARLTQICVGAGQQLPELIQTGRFPLRHGRRARCVLVSHASHERDDRRPVGKRALSVQGGVLTC